MFKTLDDITPADAILVGGKTYNCARLKQAGLPVPDGVVVPSAATDADVQLLARDRWLTASAEGARFAVRSSGIGEDSSGHSFAGIHDTQLNVDRDRIVEAVLACRRSAHSEEAQAYRKVRHLGEEDGRIGVLVQHMVPAVMSGVAFTSNPVTGADEIVINAAPGLGEALVSGRVTPDEYLLRKSDLGVMAAHHASDAPGTLDLTALGELLLRIERLYGAPQDVEWCHDGRQYWVVQSRPVTTSVARPAVVGRAAAVPRDGEIEWTRANLAEVLPDQLSPQALDAYLDLLNVGERRFFGRLMAPESELGPIIKAFHGRPYFNLAQLRRVVTFAGASFADTLRSLGHSEQIRPEDEIVVRAPLGAMIRVLPDLVRLAVSDLRAPQIFRRHQAQTEATLARLAAVDPRSVPDRDFAAMFDWWAAIAPDALMVVLLMSSVQFREDILRKACLAVGMDFNDLVYPHLAAGTRSVSTQQAVDLVALANAARGEPRVTTYLLADEGTFADFRTALAGTAFLDRFEGFLERYGHRGRYESDWALPRLHENPAPALFAIRGQLQGPPRDLEAQAGSQHAAAAAAWRAFEARLTGRQKLMLAPLVRATLRRLKQQYLWREQVRSDLTRITSRLREWHLVLADRFVARGWIDRRDDYFLLRLAEVRRACEDSAQGSFLRGIATARAAQLAGERDLRMPLFTRESALASLLQPSPAPAAVDTAELTGLCVSPGSVTGEVVVMLDPREFATMKRGAILVTTATDPSWTPLFTMASGVIVEVGGMLSHASTIAREYGLPALANVKDATRVLRTGDRVVLDASAGVVRRHVSRP